MTEDGEEVGRNVEVSLRELLLEHRESDKRNRGKTFTQP